MSKRLRGLSTSHNITEPFEAIGSVTVYEDSGKEVRQVKRRLYPARVVLFDGGSKIEVKREHYKIPQHGGGKRKAVRTFSWSSRRRLQRRLAELRREALPLFITLTYPAEYPQDYKVHKEHLRRFGIALQRRYPRASFIWRLEYQKRGAPHYHLLAYNLPVSSYKRLQSFRAWLSVKWYEIVGSGDEKHLRAGTSSEKMKSYRQTIGYVSKAVAKVSPEPEIISGEIAKEDQASAEYVGRWWGVFGSRFLPFAKWLPIKISDKQAVDFIRYMRRYARLKVTRAYKSLTIFADVSGWMKHLQKLLYSDEVPPHKSGELRSPVFAV